MSSPLFNETMLIRFDLEGDKGEGDLGSIPPTAVRGKSRFSQSVRFLFQTNKVIAAIVRHAETTMAQMIVIQFIW
jgi:hypothetical protein